MLYPTVRGGREWSSNWATGPARTLTNKQRDPQDEEFVVRGNGLVSIDGQGVATLTGDSPRMYVYDEARSKTWNNVEITFYMMRVFEAKTLSYQGMTIGTRSEHQDVGEVSGNTGKTYYSKFAYDGGALFMKETNHEEGGYQNSKELMRHASGFPIGKWVGMKFICRTRGQTVKLEQWEDLTDGKDGGRWVRVQDLTENGRWAEKPFLSPQPSVFIRNDGLGEARYKKWTIREIAP